jgi:hypothetical protein
LGNQQKKCAMTEVVCEICRKTNLVIWWVWELRK